MRICAAVLRAANLQKASLGKVCCCVAFAVAQQTRAALLFTAQCKQRKRRREAKSETASKKAPKRRQRERQSEN